LQTTEVKEEEEEEEEILKIEKCSLIQHLIVGKYISNHMLSYHRETALQGALVLAKGGRLELGDNILRTL